ncbi:MAG: hypothetical protein ABL865_00195, partial [Candidatus Nitrotoga sp.]
MTPQQFISKWQGCQLAERAFYQQHFNDLCALVGHLTPAAQRLNQLRDNWLNPPEWTDWLRTPEEEKAGYPLRP